VSERRPSIAKFAAVLAFLSLSACARPIGDFGRAEDDPLHESAANAVQIAHGLSGPATTLNWSDEELEMRDRIWRYLVSPHGYDWLGDFRVELMRLGFVRAHYKPRPKDGYYRWLTTTSFASSPVRYARLADDIDADLGMLPAAFAAICAVERVDHQRGIAANGLPNADPKMRAGAAERQAENRATIAWFTDSLDARYDAYSYALDNLLIDTPHDAAIRVDAKLSAMRSLVETADSGDFCSEAGRYSPAPRRGGPASRYLMSAGSTAGS